MWWPLLKWGFIALVAWQAYLFLSGQHATLLHALQQEFRWMLP